MHMPCLCMYDIDYALCIPCLCMRYKTILCACQVYVSIIIDYALCRPYLCMSVIEYALCV